MTFSRRIQVQYLWLAAILILTAGCVTTEKTQKTEQLSRTVVVTGIEIIDNKLNIVTDGHFEYTIYKSSDPNKVIVEFPDVSLGNFAGKIKTDKTGIIEITPSQTENPRQTRLEILLSSPVSLIEPIDKEAALIITIKEETKAKDTEIAEFPKTEERLPDVKTLAAKTDEPAKEVKQEENVKHEQQPVAQKAESKEADIAVEELPAAALNAKTEEVKDAAPLPIKTEPVITEVVPIVAPIMPIKKAKEDMPSGSDRYAIRRGSVHMRLIIVGSRNKAEEILSEIKNGKPFAFLAKERSLDGKSRDEYGYLGKVSSSKLEAPLREAASRLKDGEVSGAIKLTDNRYAIIQIVNLKYYTKGAKAFREKDFKTAEINLLKHIELNPDAVKARVMLGEIYENREETEKAIKTYKEALSFDPKHKNAYERLGKAYSYLGQYDKAKEIYEEGIKHMPDEWSLWKGMKTAKMKMSQK